MLIDTSTELKGSQGGVLEYEHVTLYASYSRAAAMRFIFSHEKFGRSKQTMLDEYFQDCRAEWRNCGEGETTAGCGDFFACDPSDDLIAMFCKEMHSDADVFSFEFCILFCRPDCHGIDSFVNANWPAHLTLHSLVNKDLEVGNEVGGLVWD